MAERKEGSQAHWSGAGRGSRAGDSREQPPGSLAGRLAPGTSVSAGWCAGTPRGGSEPPGQETARPLAPGQRASAQ
jgi:hypothetical protein